MYFCEVNLKDPDPTWTPTQIQSWERDYKKLKKLKL